MKNFYKKIAVFLLIALFLASCSTTNVQDSSSSKIKIKALILPKFEVGEIIGDFPGEAQCYYDGLFKGQSKAYKVKNIKDDNTLYVNEEKGIALILTGMSKVRSSSTVLAVLSDDRFDFSDCYFISTGCAGGSIGDTTLGDVVIASATADVDLGHNADIRDMKDKSAATWYHDESYDNSGYKIMDKKLVEKVYNLTKSLKLTTTEKSRKYMADFFNNRSWATREPKVLKGTVITADNFWKGEYDRLNCSKIVKSYNLPDRYLATEMEDNAIAVVLDRLGKLDRYIVLRDIVNTDVFMYGSTPESLWGDEKEESEVLNSADIFKYAMENNYEVGKVIIDKILEGNL